MEVVADLRRNKLLGEVMILRIGTTPMVHFDMDLVYLLGFLSSLS